MTVPRRVGIQRQKTITTITTMHKICAATECQNVAELMGRKLNLCNISSLVFELVFCCCCALFVCCCMLYVFILFHLFALLVELRLHGAQSLQRIFGKLPNGSVAVPHTHTHARTHTYTLIHLHMHSFSGRTVTTCIYKQQTISSEEVSTYKQALMGCRDFWPAPASD